MAQYRRRDVTRTTLPHFLNSLAAHYAADKLAKKQAFAILIKNKILKSGKAYEEKQLFLCRASDPV